MKTLKISIIAFIMVFAVTFAKAQVHVSVGFGVPVYHPYYAPPVYYAPQTYYTPRYYGGYYGRAYYRPHYYGRPAFYRGRGRW